MALAARAVALTQAVARAVALIQVAALVLQEVPAILSTLGLQTTVVMQTQTPVTHAILMEVSLTILMQLALKISGLRYFQKAAC